MLIKLLTLRLRGGVRQRLRELKTVRGLLFLSLTMVIIALLFKQSSLPANPLISLVSADGEQRAGQVARFMPIGLLAAYLLTVFTAPSPALYFNPAEINLLFCGPFTRGALLLYKVCFYAFGALLSSLLIMLLASAFVYRPASAFLGVFLSLMFIQLLTAATGLLGQCLRSHFDVRIRSRYLFMSLISLLGATGWFYAGDVGSLIEALMQFRGSMIGALLLAPFDVFAHIFQAQTVFSSLWPWAALGLGMNVGLLAIVITLDRYSGEAVTMANLQLHRRRERARRSGLPWGAQVVQVRSMISPPVLGGVGPLAWRQMLSACRNAGKALWVYLGMAIFAGPLLVSAGEEVPKATLLGGVFFVAVFMLPKTLVFDFRSDLESMASLKALPLAAWQISIGQVATVVLLSSLIELVLLGSTAIFIGSQWHVFLLCISFFLLPFNVLLYGLENLFFLIFPAALVPVGRVDFDFLGRTLVGFAVTAAILIGGCLLAAVVGQKVAQAMSWPWPGLAAVAWCLFALIASMTLPLLAWAFKRFDVSLGRSKG
ncbi:hypothetical protein Q9L42_019400 [Methylomarinum sp. Ch1-1]|uniref:ABC transporter permease n=1 Tax=Methylomarinum roseum TaxID=3067653 RepID=A0AAU7NTY3_9GAMM|nr:hypothetical protein [Methylomarinum sp. Ch1-1]MDP4519439.1 hypothetical protein [Methylomarinum sp. Ch1-1]